MKIKIQPENFDAGAEISALSGGVETGAIASFVGVVRGKNGVQALTLEHYPGMTERQITRLVEDAQARWPLTDVTIIHRIGTLRPGDNIVLVVVASSHRGAAFDACEFLIDQMKTNVPFWKQEEKDGRSEWVATRASDDDAAGKWHT